METVGMGDPAGVDITETVWQRARADTLRFHRTFRFWVVEIVAGGVSVALAVVWLPERLLDWAEALATAGIAIGAIFSLVGLVFVASLLLAPLRQRDKARAALATLGASPSSPILAAPQLFIRAEDHAFGEPGRPGYPQPKTGATRLLRIDVLLTPTNGLQVESIELEVQGKRIPSTWKSSDVYGVASGGYIYFEVPSDVTPGPHQVSLVALADGKWWESPHFSLTFPAQ